MHDLLRKNMAVSTLITPTGVNGGPVDFNTTGDKFILTPAAPIEIYRWGIATIELMDPDAGGFVISLEHRPTIGSDVGRTVAATITRADAETVAAGALVFNEVVLAVAQATGVDGSLVNVGPAGPLRVNQGEEAVVEVTNAVGAASTGYIWIEYVQLPFDATDAIKELT